MTDEDGTISEGSKPPPLERPAPPARPLAPVTEKSRIKSLDVIRGVALFGILLVNIQSFAFPPSAFNDPTALEATLGPVTTPDWVAFWGTEILCEMKFVTMFSLLFGVSIGMLAAKGFSRGVDPEQLLMLRFVVLLGFGAAHALGLWFGDILFHYGLLAIVVLATLRFHSTAVKALAAVAFMIPLVLSLGIGLVESNHPGALGIPENATAEIAEELRIYGSGSYEEIFQHNGARWMLMTVANLILFSGRTLACFWIGVLVVKHGFLVAERRRRLVRNLAVFALLPGLLIEGTRSYAMMILKPTEAQELTINFPIQYLGSMLLAFGYIGALGLWVERGGLGFLQRGLASVGRMALTSYLTHTVVCVTLFYSVGFGFYGQAPRWSLPLIAAAILSAQMVLATLWLRQFHFGPMEWLWRSLCYQSLQPFRRIATA